MASVGRVVNSCRLAGGSIIVLPWKAHPCNNNPFSWYDIYIMSIPWRWWVISIWMNRNQPSTWECWGELTTSWLFSIEEHLGTLQGGTIHWVWVVHWRWFYFGSSPTISSRRYISYRMPSTMPSLNQDLPISCSTWEALDPWWRSNRSQWCLLLGDR